MYIAGLDIGTTGCKIVLFDRDGKQVMTAYREYEVKRNKGLHEVDVPGIWKAVKEVFAETSGYGLSAVGVTSFGESFVIVDENGAPLAPTMLYTDPRGKEECVVLENRFGKDFLAFSSGTKIHEMYSLPKLMWLKSHMPEIWQKAKAILLMQDYIVWQLCGVRQIDYSLAARTAAFDIRNKCWMTDLFSFAGVDVSLMSTPVPAGTVAGKIKGELAEELGISPELTVVSGCQDQIAALLGAGVTSPGQAMDGIGTVECVPIVLSEIPRDASVYEGGYSVVPHVGDTYACYLLSYAGGATLKWYRDKMVGLDYPALDKLVPEAPTDLLVLPHFAGAATPYMDSSATAAILGLTFEHGKGDVYKALMEGTSYEILLNLRNMEELGLTLSGVVATGGGAKSPVWLQIKADIFGLPVTSLDSGEIGAAGTALLAGKALGFYGDGTKLVGQKSVFTPNPENHEFYAKQYEKYRKIYPAVKGVLSHE